MNRKAILAVALTALVVTPAFAAGKPMHHAAKKAAKPMSGDAMQAGAMAPDAMQSDAMKPDAMNGDTKGHSAKKPMKKAH